MNNILNSQISMKDILTLFQQQEKDFYLKDIIPLYLNHKRLYTKPGTIDFYKEHLKKINEYLECKEVYTLRGINKQVLDDFVLFCKSKGNKNIYINKMLKSLDSLIKFAEENEYISPMNFKYKRLPEEITKIDIISNEDMKKIVSYLPCLSVRSQAMFLLLLSTGIRSKELTMIETDNIDFNTNRIYLDKTKTKPRFTSIVPDVVPILKQVIKENNNSKWLFPEKSSHIETDAVRSLLARIKKALNIKVLSAHKIRHFYATHLLKNGVDIKTVSRLLGHTTIRMTERYLDITETELFEKNQLMNPLNTFKIKS